MAASPAGNAESRCSKTLYIWQEILPQIGFRYPFVLHGFLSLAALHIAYTSPTERTQSWLVGMHHHNEALTGFQRELSTITEENSEALFTWSICNVLYVFATSNPLYQGIGGGPTSLTSAQKEKVLGTEWIPMMRGLEAVQKPTYNYLRSGRMKAIMSNGNWAELDPEQESQDPEDAHFCHARKSWNDPDHAEVYEEALQVLRKCRLYSSQFREMDSETRSNWGYNKEWVLAQRGYPKPINLVSHIADEDMADVTGDSYTENSANEWSYALETSLDGHGVVFMRLSTQYGRCLGYDDQPADRA
ncbi:UPC2-regulatory involved in control of sterol uptake [Fusarium agapanthi]|uniref:UPC2-regulatory involved in control of sterol uptake n=1 Tax=Fusarium agapanthi TaxID=1803897 RepID=A0A9P5BFU4_9HYPO|nr:UPC2-regulatory involved in control of sterol uptake [Fusarium agapanthi]